MTVQSAQELHEELVETQETIDAAETRKQELITELQQVCGHQIFAEYRPAEGEPIRICISCLLEETGWGTGYHRLRGSSQFLGRGECAVIDLDELKQLRKPRRLVEVRLPVIA